MAQATQPEGKSILRKPVWVIGELRQVADMLLMEQFIQCGVLASQALFLMWLVIEDHDNLFIMAECVHFAGIGMLLYKLFSKKNAGGKHASSLDPIKGAGCPIYTQHSMYSFEGPLLLFFRPVSEGTGVDCAFPGNKAIL